jgi:GT2 family glycosyltransferase
MISIVVPIHNMKNKDFFLKRCLDSIRSQTYQDYEIIITEKGKMAENTNAGMREATGELVKILFMDDFFAHKNALKEIVDNFKKDDVWMITGADTNPHPYWTDDIHLGNNKLGSPSALTMRKDKMMFFDETMSWLLDCDLYKRMYNKYGPPKILDKINVNLGVGDHQMTHILTDEEKLKEHNYMEKKWK